jgi:hypothetical protein
VRSISAGSLIGVLSLVATAGCTGSGRLSAVPFTRNDISDQEALITTLPTAGTCAWYTDSEERVNVVMRHRGPALPGKPPQSEWVMWIRAGKPPAGSGLRYRIERGAARGLCTAAMAHQRFESRWGVLVLGRQSGERFRGRFQISAAQQQFTLFTGWTPAGAMAPLLILVGEFEAVHDEKLGREMAKLIEKEDWAGLSPALPILISPTTRPAVRPAATRPTTRPTTRP